MPNQLKNNDICPICEISNLRLYIIDDELTCFDKTIILKNIEILHCEHCDESFYTIESENIIDKLFLECKKKYKVL